MSNDPALMWVAAMAFTDVHHGIAITEEEFQRRLALLDDYKDEIAEARKIIASIKEFQTWPYEKQVNYAVVTLLSLREKKNNESIDFSTKEAQIARVSAALEELRQYDDCAKEQGVEEVETYDNCAKNIK